MSDKKRPEDEAVTDGPEQVEAFDPLPGDVLRAARHRRGWTIARVAEDMNLEARFVEAMEENRFEDLGAPVFARGHLRKYARLLELDMEQLMGSYTVIEQERIPSPPTTVEGLAMTGDVPSRRRSWRTLAVVIVILAVAALVWRLLATKPDAPAPADGPAPQGSLRENTPDDDALIDEPVAVPLPALVGSGEQPAPPSEAVPETEAETEAEAASAAATAAADSSQPPPAAGGEGATAPAAADGVELVLRFVADTWVEVRDASGDRLVYQLGRAGQQRTVRGTPPFDIFLGFADGVSLELDGEPVSIPPGARLGRTARFRLPADSAAAIRP